MNWRTNQVVRANAVPQQAARARFAGSFVQRITIFPIVTALAAVWSTVLASAQEALIVLPSTGVDTPFGSGAFGRHCTFASY
jgi:uncharacterized protein (DUF2062 family)